MPLPSRRDPEALRRALEAWFAERLAGPVSVGPISVPEGTGMSSETLLFDLSHGAETSPIVVRMRPDMSDWPVFPHYDLAKQAAAMQFVGSHSDVPVPEVRFVEEDEDRLGAPFIVMTRVNGQALPDMPPYTFGGSFLDGIDADARRAYHRNFFGLQARIHAIDLDHPDAAFLGAVDGDCLGRQLAAQRAYFDWARQDLEVPIIDEGLAWLAQHRPRDPGPTVINWGDARPGNVLFDGVNPRAVLDWEMVDVGPAGIDVGWAVFMHSFFQSVAGVFELPGFPDLFRPDDALTDYTAAGGGDVTDLDWYVMYASVRFAIIGVRTSSREIAYGNREPVADPQDLIMHLAMFREQLDARS